MNPPPRRHGNVKIGRLVAITALLLTTAGNGPLYRSAHFRPHPMVGLELAAIFLPLWMLAGVAGVCFRNMWGRYLAFIVLEAGLAGYLFAAVLMLMERDPAYAGLPPVLFATAGVHLLVLALLAYSRHFRRLTSRAWD